METVQLAARVIDTRLVNSDQVFLLSADLENCLNVGLSRLGSIPGGRINFDRESTRRLGSFDWDGRTLFLLNGSIRNDGFGDLYLYNSDTREIVQLNPIEGNAATAMHVSARMENTFSLPTSGTTAAISCCIMSRLSICKTGDRSRPSNFQAGSFPPPGKSHNLTCDQQNDKSRFDAGF